MTTIVGLTGGIASGKSTVVHFLKKKRFAVHDSDKVVKNIYSKPAPKFIKYLKKIKKRTKKNDCCGFNRRDRIRQNNHC